MSFKRILWGICIVGIVLFLWLLYPQKETPRPEKTPDGEKAAGVTGPEIEKASISDTLIARTAKLIIRQAINHSDIEQMRVSAVKKIRKKSDRSYQREMKKIFDDVEYMRIKDTFGLSRNSSRDEVIKVIENVDKDTLLNKLDEIPDVAIAKLIKKKLHEQRIDSVAKLKDYLNKKIYRLTKTTSG